MKNTSDVIACVVDFGMFPHVAKRVAKEFKKVYYTTPWDDSFPRINRMIIGDGYSEFEWIESVWDAKDADLYIFPDIGMSGLQLELVRQNKAVWGSRNADSIESSRGKFLSALEECGLSVPPFQKIKGITNLRLFLKENPDKYIKVSCLRGDFETFHFRSMDEDKNQIDVWASILGPFQDENVFYVFDPVKTEIEGGCDSWCIDGQWPETFIQGFENKDKAYLMAFQEFDKMAPEIRVINEKFGPILAKFGYRGMFSTEVRITEDDESFFIDPTCRFASPVSQGQVEMIGNLGEIIWHGANGILVEPEQAAKFGAQAIFKVDRDHWGVFKIPEEIEQFVKISFSCKSNGLICVPPDPQGVAEIGWCVGIGDTIEDAIEHLREVVDQMPAGVTVEFGSLTDLLKELKTAEEAGIELTPDEIPEPKIILAEP